MRAFRKVALFKDCFAVRLILGHYPESSPEDVIRRLRYSTFVSLRHRYMYFEVPKAACSTMKELLHEMEELPPIRLFAGEMWETRRDMFIHARENISLPSLVDLDDETQREVLESHNFLRLTVVRNPYSRLASAWSNKVRLCEPGLEYLYLEIRGHLPELKKKSLLSFQEFVDYIAQRDLTNCDPHWRRQVDHLYLRAIPFSHIGKLESLDSTLLHFQAHLRSNRPLPAGKSNTHNSWAAAFTEPLADNIYSLYREDFEAFGYGKNSWQRHSGNASNSTGRSVIAEEKFNDEIVERNLVISSLYQERDRLLSQLQRRPSALLGRAWRRWRNVMSL
jgi:sulfotransferase famil protein